MYCGTCFLCKGSIYQDDEKVMVGYEIAHYCRHESEMEEMREATKEFEAEWKTQAKRDNKIIRRLKRNLKPKIWQCIDWVFSDCIACDFLEIVDVNATKGERVRGSDYFGESVAVRHVYDDTCTDYWGDGFSGSVYLPIGCGRYLRMSVRG